LRSAASLRHGSSASSRSQKIHGGRAGCRATTRTRYGVGVAGIIGVEIVASHAILPFVTSGHVIALIWILVALVVIGVLSLDNSSFHH